jgi:hypothetical protein
LLKFKDDTLIKLSAALLSTSLGALALLGIVLTQCGQPDIPDAPTIVEPVPVVVPVPELLSPLDNAEVSLTPSLLTSIVEVDGETVTQHLEIRLLDGAVVFQDVIEQGVPLTVSGLDYGNVYSWRARAIAGAHESDWSDSRAFLTPVYVVELSSLSELCAFAASLPFNALPADPVPYRDAIIEASGNPLVGLHHRPNGRISHDIVALNIPAEGQPHQIVDIVGSSTGCCPTRICLDQTATIESGSVFQIVN